MGMNIWLMVLAALFIVATVTNSTIFTAAAQLEDNREHFESAQQDPETFGVMALYGPLALFVAMIAIAAGLVAMFGSDSPVALAALVLTNLVLVLQFLQIRLYWNRALFSSEASNDD